MSLFSRVDDSKPSYLEADENVISSRPFMTLANSVNQIHLSDSRGNISMLMVKRRDHFDEFKSLDFKYDILLPDAEIVADLIKKLCVVFDDDSQVLDDYLESTEFSQAFTERIKEESQSILSTVSSKAPVAMRLRNHMNQRHSGYSGYPGTPHNTLFSDRPTFAYRGSDMINPNMMSRHVEGLSYDRVYSIDIDLNMRTYVEPESHNEILRYAETNFEHVYARQHILDSTKRREFIISSLLKLINTVHVFNPETLCIEAFELTEAGNFAKGIQHKGSYDLVDFLISKSELSN